MSDAYLHNAGYTYTFTSVFDFCLYCRLPLCDQGSDAGRHWQWGIHWERWIFREHVRNKVREKHKFRNCRFKYIHFQYKIYSNICSIYSSTPCLSSVWSLVYSFTCWYKCPLHPTSSKAAVQDVQAKNLICILDIDMQGVKNIKKTDLNPIYVSIQPPSMDELVRRPHQPQHILMSSSHVLQSRHVMFYHAKICFCCVVGETFEGAENRIRGKSTEAPASSICWYGAEWVFHSS